MLYTALITGDSLVTLPAPRAARRREPVSGQTAESAGATYRCWTAHGGWVGVGALTPMFCAVEAGASAGNERFTGDLIERSME